MQPTSCVAVMCRLVCRPRRAPTHPYLAEHSGGFSFSCRPKCTCIHPVGVQEEGIASLVQYLCMYIRPSQPLRDQHS